MVLRTISTTGIEVSALGLGTWAFGGDIWWGPQEDRDSVAVLEQAPGLGITLIDTAPVYGRGRAENVIGAFLEKRNLREKVVLATKLGLSWQGRAVSHDLTGKRMRQEIDESRRRLRTDYIDIYQVHWPDPGTPVEETADVMREFYQKGMIRAIGVSNYSLEQIKTFMAHSPLHVLQPRYNMFQRDIEDGTVPFCRENGISILAYMPLYSGVLTGKFFRQGVPVPGDLCRRNCPELKEPLFSINRDALAGIGEIAASHGRTLTQLVLNWTACRPGIASVLAGSRYPAQIAENAAAMDFTLSENDIREIEDILALRRERIADAGLI